MINNKHTRQQGFLKTRCALNSTKSKENHYQRMLFVIHTHTSEAAENA